MSPVRNPLFRVSKTAVSILWAALASPKPYFKSIAALRMVAKGFALSCILDPCSINIHINLRNRKKDRQRKEYWTFMNSTCPAISGADPCIGSKSPGPCRQIIAKQTRNQVSFYYTTSIYIWQKEEYHSSVKQTSKLKIVRKAICSQYLFAETSRWKHPNTSRYHRSLIR